MTTRHRAIVFAYHNVGVRCLRVLLDAGVEVALVVTHEDSANENIWFGSVLATARREGLPVVTPTDPNCVELLARIRALAPDFIFSFYYRQMLGVPLLELARLGALNMHGSLLPRYRGRAPVNWAVLHGEPSTGASLHYMVAKPDAGDLVAQTEVPILENDTAGEVFEKVTVAAEQTLWRALPALLAQRAPRQPLDLAQGQYFGGRKPEDGRLRWSQGGAAVHNLVRAVAPPYPGAWFELAGFRFELLETRAATVTGELAAALAAAGMSNPLTTPILVAHRQRLHAVWPAGVPALPDRSGRHYPALELRDLRHAGKACGPAQLRELLCPSNALPAPDAPLVFALSD